MSWLSGALADIGGFFKAYGVDLLFTTIIGVIAGIVAAGPKPDPRDRNQVRVRRFQYLFFFVFLALGYVLFRRAVVAGNIMPINFGDIANVTVFIAGAGMMLAAARPQAWFFDVTPEGNPGQPKIHWLLLISCWAFFTGWALAWHYPPLRLLGSTMMLLGWLGGGYCNVPLLEIFILTLFKRPIYTRRLSIGHNANGWLENGFGLFWLPLWLPGVTVTCLIQNIVEMTGETDEIPTAGSSTKGLTKAPIKFKLWMLVFQNADPRRVLQLSPPDRAQVKKMSLSAAAAWFAETILPWEFESAMAHPFFVRNPKLDTIQGQEEFSSLQAMCLRNVGHTILEAKVQDRNVPKSVQAALDKITELEAQSSQADILIQIEEKAGRQVVAKVKTVAAELGLSVSQAWEYMIRELQMRNLKNVQIGGDWGSVAKMLGVGPKS